MLHYKAHQQVLYVYIISDPLLWAVNYLIPLQMVTIPPTSNLQCFGICFEEKIQKNQDPWPGVRPGQSEGAWVDHITKAAQIHPQSLKHTHNKLMT